MNDDVIRNKKKFIRVREYIEARAAAFSPSTLGAELHIELVKVIDELDEHSTSQEVSSGAAKKGTGNKALLRDELYEGLMAIYRTARVIAVKNPNFDDEFRRPPRNNDQLLLNSARAYAEKAAPFVEEFLRYEMPKDFLDQLNKTADLFEKAITQRVRGVSEQVEATEAIDDVMDRGMVIIRALDVIVRNKFADDAPALGAWFSARYAERAPKSAPAQDAPATESSN